MVASRSTIFGWSYPPGVSSVPGDEPDPPCGVCGQLLDDCICSECPICYEIGNPACYDGTWKCSWCGTHADRDQCFPWKTPAFGRTLEHVWQESHGLVRSFAQVTLMTKAERRWEEENEEMVRRRTDCS